MTSKNQYPIRNRDMQDGIERHIYGEIEKVDGAGHIIRVRGTGTEDEECVVLSVNGIGIKMPKNTDAEVHVIAGASDSDLKFAIVTIPRDKEHPWADGTNGQQKWDDPDTRLEFNAKRTHATGKAFAVTPTGVFEVIDGKVYVRGDLYVQGEVKATVVPPVPIPAFDP